MPYHIMDLSWLPEVPPDFRAKVRALGVDAFSLKTLRALAGFKLGGPQLHLLGSAIGDLSAHKPSSSVKLGVLSNGTTDILRPALVASAMRHGVWMETVGTSFGQVVQEALNPGSTINAAKCDFVLLAIDHRELPLISPPGDAERAREAVEASLSHLEAVARSIHETSGATIIVQTLPQHSSALFGSLDRSIPGSPRWLIDEFNRELRSRFTDTHYLLLDVASLAELVGLAEWHNEVQWNFGKLLFSQRCVPLYADWLGRLVAAARGLSRKCLVLDLDNTIWGGVIGDDGLAGIVLGNGNPTGEAFLHVQRIALALRDRGVLLAVSSKNDDAIARSAFQSHPEMILKEEHIAVFQANWQDKASNLRAIAEALNFSPAALVLLDDNPAEREQVRQALPEVAVPELPSDPSLYVDILLAAGYFEAVRFTVEDKARAGQYQAEAKRAALKGAVTDLDQYWRSLEMRAIFSRFDEIGRPRITQLINKTNQFNLTTRRYTEAQVQAIEQSEEGLALQIRLVDKFSDNGMIAVVICVPEGPDWGIDTWLMSCRVLNRKVEQTTLDFVVSKARACGVRRLIGRYIPTERNGMVRDHYPRLGFADLDENTWILELSDYQLQPVPIEVSESGFKVECK